MRSKLRGDARVTTRQATVKVLLSSNPGRSFFNLLLHLQQKVEGADSGSQGAGLEPWRLAANASAERRFPKALTLFAWAIVLVMSSLAAPAAESARADAASQLAPCFQPPPEPGSDLGAFRSPLLFANGQPVRDAKDWARRRREILETWHRFMGPWPEVIERPNVERLERKERDGFRQERVRVQIARDQTVEGYLLTPGGRGPFPAVLVPYYEPLTSIGLTNELRDFAYQLTRRGFVTLSIGSPGGDARQPVLGAAACQPLSFLAYVAANSANALARLPEVDGRRIGVVGHSYGGKWAMFAACLHERFACAAWSDPGIVFDETRPNVNYWERWYLGAEPGKSRPPGVPSAPNPRTGAYRELVAAGHDLHELHVLVAPRPFLVSGGSEDPPERWRALNHAVAVNRLLGFTNRVAMTNRKTHAPTPESNEVIYRFFEFFLGREAE